MLERQNRLSTELELPPGEADRPRSADSERGAPGDRRLRPGKKVRNLVGKVSVIIPAYNEGKCIVSSIRETKRIFDEFECDYEIIIVDDGSRDDTYKQIVDFARRHNGRAGDDGNGDGNGDRGKVIVKRNRSNYGKGRALKKGFRYATGEYIVFLDADMELHPAQIRNFFNIMELDGVDAVIGSKRHPDSRLYYPWYRRVMSAVYYFLVKLVFKLPVRDTQTGLKLFKRECLDKTLPRILIKSFAYDLEILACIHRFGYKIAEAPIVLNSQRRFGRISMRTIYKTLWDTMAIYYQMHIVRRYDQN